MRGVVMTTIGNLLHALVWAVIAFVSVAVVLGLPSLAVYGLVNFKDMM
jgi:hypothetical protein